MDAVWISFDDPGVHPELLRTIRVLPVALLVVLGPTPLLAQPVPSLPSQPASSLPPRPTSGLAPQPISSLPARPVPSLPPQPASGLLPRPTFGQLPQPAPVLHISGGAETTGCRLVATVLGAGTGMLVGGLAGAFIERALSDSEDAGVTGLSVGMVFGAMGGIHLARRSCEASDEGTLRGWSRTQAEAPRGTGRRRGVGVGAPHLRRP